MEMKQTYVLSRRCTEGGHGSNARVKTEAVHLTHGGPPSRTNSLTRETKSYMTGMLG